MSTSEGGVPPAALASGSSAEDQAAAFANDPRVHYDQQAGAWRFEQDDGTELEYDAAKGAWLPVLDEDLVKAQQAAYSVAGVDEETPAAPVLKRTTKKRKEPDDGPVNIAAGNKRGKKASASDNNGASTSTVPERKSKNTAIYITGLPQDTDADEIIARFGKFGIIEEDDAGDPKVKLYAREDGTFSGDALVVYFKEESVELAITMLDDAELRVGDPSTRMRGQGGAGRRKPRRTMEDKKRATRRIGKMQKRDKANVMNKHGRVVVLKHMFTLKELEEDTSLLLDLKEDVREECSTLGEVTNVVLYDVRGTRGIMTVKFKDPLSAQACVIKMNGRFFSGRRIEASLYAGRQRFKRSGQSSDVLGDNEDTEKKRLDDFAQWLMAEGE
ncbi:hypothetical protein C8T65DRAFT_711081 [Cerioporus squamosus]|nr:hypothetical protein C8T65DRAFT_711081 [Cerioporus squamosus]